MTAEKDAVPTTGTVTLEGVDATPAQTWNRLSVNDRTLVVPTVTETPAADEGPSARPATTAQADDLVADIECGGGHAATTWLDAAATKGRTVRVAAGQTADVDVDLTTADLTGDGTSVARTVIVLGEGARAHVSVIARDADAATTTPVGALLGHVLRIEAGRDAHAFVSLVVALEGQARMLESVGARLGDGATVDVTHHVLSCPDCSLGLACELAGDGSTATIDSRYLVGDGQRLDMGYLIRQEGHDTTGLMDVSGVLADHAEKALRATIDLRHGCKGSHGREKESVILAGDDVINRTLPVILCDEDDVAADHGATIGSIAPEQMVYLADRGLTPDDVAALVTESVVGLAAGRTHGHARKAVLAHARRTLGTEVAQRIEEDL
jgi:Fe-S cluster assembly scaffold protein SufB